MLRPVEWWIFSRNCLHIFTNLSVPPSFDSMFFVLSPSGYLHILNLSLNSGRHLSHCSHFLWDPLEPPSPPRKLNNTKYGAHIFSYLSKVNVVLTNISQLDNCDIVDIYFQFHYLRLGCKSCPWYLGGMKPVSLILIFKKYNYQRCKSS